MPSARSRTDLVLIVLLLLLQLALRVHRPAALPLFIDEYRHITRAQAVYDLGHNPADDSHGKILLYFWLGLFRPEGTGAVAVSRLAVALSTLIGGAALAAIARALVGRGAMIAALLFYALLPHAVFFDRMALADPFAGALAALCAWLALRVAWHPTRARGRWAGLVIALTALAKLTTAGLLALPLIAVILFSRVPLPRRNLVAIQGWSRAVWVRCGRALNAVRNVYALPWVLFFALVLISLASGGRPVIVDTHLIAIRAQTDDVLSTKLDTAIMIFERLVGGSMALGLVALAILLLWKRPRPALFVLAWLALLWGPSLAFGINAEARYLAIGTPALAVIFGGGIVLAGQMIGGTTARLVADPARARARQGIAALLVIAVTGGWAAGFALPFDRDAARDPAALRLPTLDTYIFFSGPANAWGVREALAHLEQHGDRAADRIPALGVFTAIRGADDFCGLFDLVVTDAFAWDCLTQHDFPGSTLPDDPGAWPVLVHRLAQHPFIYVVTDTFLPSDPPPGWEAVFTTRRPHGGAMVIAWRVTP